MSQTLALFIDSPSIAFSFKLTKHGSGMSINSNNYDVISRLGSFRNPWQKIRTNFS